MRFTARAKDLLDAVKAVSRAATSKLDLVTTNVLLDAGDKTVYVSATNRTLFLGTSADADVAERGRSLVNAEKLLAFLKATKGDVTASADDTKITLSSPSSQTTLPTADPAAFPALVTTDTTNPALGPLSEVDPGDLALAIGTVSFARSKNAERSPAYEGISLEPFGGKLAVVATDGVTLACATVATSAHAVHGSNECRALIPAPIAEAIIDLAEQDFPPGAVSVRLAGDNITFRHDRFVAASPCVAGKFIDWQKVIARLAPVASWRVLKADALQAVAAASVTTDNLKPGADLSADGKTLTAETASAFGQSSGVAPTTDFSGSPTKIRLSPQRLLQAAARAPGKDLMMDTDGKKYLRVISENYFCFVSAIE